MIQVLRCPAVHWTRPNSAILSQQFKVRAPFGQLRVPAPLRQSQVPATLQRSRVRDPSAIQVVLGPDLIQENSCRTPYRQSWVFGSIRLGSLRSQCRPGKTESRTCSDSSRFLAHSSNLWFQPYLGKPRSQLHSNGMGSWPYFGKCLGSLESQPYFGKLRSRPYPRQFWISFQSIDPILENSSPSPVLAILGLGFV